MSLATPPAKSMTAEDLYALPEDGIHREIIRGELREHPDRFNTRWHSGAQAAVTKFLVGWLCERPELGGAIYSGGFGFRLRRDPLSVVAMDVAYVSKVVREQSDPRKPFIDGAPALAVEILSPWDTHQDIVEKVILYNEVGAVVWVVDPNLNTVVVHRPGQLPEMFNASQELDGEPELPGFRVAVAALFGVSQV